MNIERDQMKPTFGPVVLEIAVNTCISLTKNNVFPLKCIIKRKKHEVCGFHWFIY